MEWFKKFGTKITGSITGSCLVLFNQTAPMDAARNTYTLEELAYQDNHQTEESGKNESSLLWITDRGCILLQDEGRAIGTHHHTVGLRRAIHRSVVDR